MSGAPGGSVTATIASEFVRTRSPSRGREPRQRALRSQQAVGAERAGGENDPARRERPPAPAQPGARSLGHDLVALGAVRRAKRPHVDHHPLRQHLGPGALRQPQVVLDERVLGPVRAADHAAPAAQAARPVRPGAAEIGVRHRAAGLREEHADAGLRVRVLDPDLARVLAQQVVRGVVLVVGDHPEHPLGGVVVRRQVGAPSRPGPPTAGPRRSAAARGRACSRSRASRRPRPPRSRS